MILNLSVSRLLGSEEERIAVETACRYGSKPDVYSIRQPEDVSVEVSTDGGELQMGHNASIRITTSNKSQSARSAVLHGQISVMYYTGVIKATVKKDIINIDLLPGEGKKLGPYLLGFVHGMDPAAEPKWRQFHCH